MSECASCLSSNVLIEDTNASSIIPSKDDVTNSKNNMSDSEDDNDLSFTRVRAKSTRFAESDSETDKENNFAKSHAVLSPLKSSSDDDSSNGKVIYKKKSRIKSNSNSDSESQADQDNKETYQYELTRTKIKSKKLQDKFINLKKSTKNGLMRPRFKSKSSDDSDNQSSDTDDGKRNSGLVNSDDENSCLKIKQNVVNKSAHTLASICDPDTSDEESNFNAKPQKPRQKCTKLTSPKPVKMTAKVAMENMQKIKSESNRMLREKEVSLPYHRPKALSLKDIMSKRRPALTSDGKSLPIKMNNEQLKHYVSLLEQRQKEMIELCKSDTEDEEENCPENSEKQPEDADECLGGGKPTEEHCTVSSETNDKMFDITIEQSLNESKESNLERQNSEEQIDSELQLENVVKVNDPETVAENVLDQNKTLEISTETQNNPTVDIVNQNINNDQYETDTIHTETVTENILNQVETSTKDTDFFSKNELLIIKDINKSTEEESQIISLHYDTDRTEEMDVDNISKEKSDTTNETEIVSKKVSDGEKQKQNLSDEFSDNEFTIEDLNRIIEDAEINKGISNKPNISNTLKITPKLTGAPGMVINLDEEDSSNQNKLTGVELLKERYTYFAKLKSLEDKEKDREKKFKPGIQHQKLKQELEEQIAEQRSLEWEKRLIEESKLKAEMNEVDGEGFDGEDIEKIEEKLEETEGADDLEDNSSEEEIEDDVDMTDKPRKRNPMVDDEAEESEDEATDNIGVDKKGNEDDEHVENDDKEKVENSSESEEDDDDSTESELEEEQTKPKKGRILKAFEDSDDEEFKVDSKENNPQSQNDIAESQDDDIQLAQLQRSYSEDLFTSQECSQKSKTTDKPNDVYNTSFENELGTQTFSILKSSSLNTGIDNFPEKLDVLCETQPCSDDNFDAIVGMCTGNFVENLVSPQAVSSQLTQSQELGDDVAALCTGKFYDNPLISQSEIDNENDTADDSMNVSNSETQIDSLNIQDPVNNVEELATNPNSKILLDDVENPEKSVDDRKNVDQTDNKLLKSILDELDDPEFDVPKPNKYFFSENINQDIGSTQPVDNTQAKKKFIIESDDETNGEAEVVSKKKKRKKRKLEDRALQFSDDEEYLSEQEEEAYESDIEDDNNRLVEYDSEENEVEIQAKPSKKKRAGAFFEQEAELTSEDEWVGSGDEDEAGLDRMEREEGDDDTFHQGKLQRELGEIHMREVLDQDKREVRLIQELLFEDGDLGDGHRQRKFRWKNADGEEEIGTNADAYADTQEDEFESEEQWRKQRHEREMFLRSLQEKDEEDANVTINRSALIKANLSSKATPNVTGKVMNTTEKPKTHETERKTSSDIPSPMKPFTMFQQSYHNSLLTRGRGALARLAALATPLAGDDDAPKVNASSARGNFVFAAITPEETEPKVTKRKADANPDTPRLLKKMRKQDSNKNSKISILDHL